MKRINLIVLILLLFTSCENSVEKDIDIENFELIKLAEGVYACIHKFGGKAICNSGIVDNGNETIIFDSFLSPEAANELIEAVKELELSPIKYVINSHGHNDHIRGNQSFDSDVEIIATKKTKEKIENEEPESIMAEKEYAKARFEYFENQMKNYGGDTNSRKYLELKMMKPYFEELSISYEKIKTRLPNNFVEKEKRLNGVFRDVILIEFDSCHTVSDLVMYLPKEKILFSGDIIFNKFHPFLADGNSKQLKNSLRDLKEMEIDMIVPGHGNVGNKQLLSIMTNYVEDLELVVEQAIKRDEGLEELRTKTILNKYQDWWLGNFYSMNLEYLYKMQVDQ